MDSECRDNFQINNLAGGNLTGDVTTAMEVGTFTTKSLVSKEYADNIIPIQTAHNGKYLTTNGNSLSWVPGNSIIWDDVNITTIDTGSKQAGGGAVGWVGLLAVWLLDAGLLAICQCVIAYPASRLLVAGLQLRRLVLGLGQSAHTLAHQAGVLLNAADHTALLLSLLGSLLLGLRELGGSVVVVEDRSLDELDGDHLGVRVELLEGLEEGVREVDRLGVVLLRTQDTQAVSAKQMSRAEWGCAAPYWGGCRPASRPAARRSRSTARCPQSSSPPS